MEEIWKDIPGYEGLYQVSNLGRVKSMEREVFSANYIRHMPESIKKPQRHSNGNYRRLFYQREVRKRLGYYTAL